MDPKDWDGDIWGDSESNIIEVEALEQKDVRPLIKPERQEGPQGRNPRITVHTTPWMRPNLVTYKLSSHR